MIDRPLYLLKSRESSTQRSHFAIFVPDSTSADAVPTDSSASCTGTLINVVGAPMTGYQHEVKYGWTPTQSLSPTESVLLGHVKHDVIDDTIMDTGDANAPAKSSLIDIAMRLAPPRINENFLAPVNETTNRRCQEWTMDYLRALVRAKILPQEAIETAQAERDAPNHGIGLRPVEQRV